VVMLYKRIPEKAPRADLHPIGGSCVLVALAILLVWLGVYPEPLLNVVRRVLPM
jgi:NADH:ubiquinone oxidoreductase subunit 4 (subunit M)